MNQILIPAFFYILALLHTKKPKPMEYFYYFIPIEDII